MHAPDSIARSLAAALCAASLVWAVALPAAALARGSDGSALLRRAAFVPYAVGAVVCHQRPERSFVIRGVPWPVCARCSGLYLSAAAAIAAVIAFSRRAPSGLGRPRRWRPALVFSAAPTLASWAFEHAGLWQPGNSGRAWLAVPLGAVIGALVALAARGVLADAPRT